MAGLVSSRAVKFARDKCPAPNVGRVEPSAVGQEGQASWQCEEASIWTVLVISVGTASTQSTANVLVCSVQLLYTNQKTVNRRITEMTSVERARRFIQARGKAIAMTIVPLAAIAIAASQPARAANVLVFGSGGCNVTEVGVLAAPLAECSATPIPGFQNNANSIKLSGDSFVIFAGGSGSVTFDLNGGANGGIPSQ